MDILNKLEQKMNIAALNFAISKQIFCPYSNNVLDNKNAILVTSKRDGKHIQTTAIHGKYKDKIEEIKAVSEAKGFTVEIFTNIK